MKKGGKKCFNSANNFFNRFERKFSRSSDRYNWWATKFWNCSLPDIAVRESKERIKSAIKNSGVELNSRKILINLAPSVLKKREVDMICQLQ